MNRIILIGNGFDKAHGLPTGYDDFIKDYWLRWIDELADSSDKIRSDLLCEFIINVSSWNWSYVIQNYKKYFNDDNKKILDTIRMIGDDFSIIKTPFFTSINNALSEKRWVDIENEYYVFLKEIFNGRYSNEYPKVDKLNSQLKYLKEKLVTYLLDIQNERLKDNIIIPRIKQIIYEPFRAKDISVGGREKFNEFVKYMWNKDIVDIQDWKQRRDLRTNTQKLQRQYRFEDLYDYYKEVLDKAEKRNTDATNVHIENIYEYKENAWYNRNSLDYFLYPEYVMLLTFNYTNSADIYKLENSSNVEVNHIHGELTNPDNIIFGYGDDTDEDYARIEKLNDNAYLDNIKAFHYNGSVNYRRMLEFIESAPYQIYIMGHSCGTSDRTLLNTLFEHENCISIKPYYHLKEDGSDDYMEKVQNISRNFKDKKLMRDKVVNQTFCEPLVR